MISNKSLVVLGIGNTVRMDDGAGIRVVEELEEEFSLQGFNISFKYLNTGGLDILDEIDGYNHAIIVDAANIADQELNPGDFFHIRNLLDYQDETTDGISSHGIGILSVLKYSKVGGYNLPGQIEVYGIQVKETGFFSEDLTPEVAKGVKKLVIVLKTRILNSFKLA